jgi:hypothetical protein
MRIFRSVLVACAALLISPPLAAQDEVAKPAVPVEDPCRAPPPDNAGEDVAQRTADLQAGLTAISNCSADLIARAERLLKGEELDTDAYDQDLLNLLNSFSQRMRSVSGADGVLEVLQRVVAKQDRDIEQARTRSSSPDQDPELADMIELRDRMRGGIEEAEKQISGINEAILAINATRPAIARKLRQKDGEELASDLESWNAMLSSTREKLEGLTLDVKPGAETGN